MFYRNKKTSDIYKTDGCTCASGLTGIVATLLLVRDTSKTTPQGQCKCKPLPVGSPRHKYLGWVIHSVERACQTSRNYLYLMMHIQSWMYTMLLNYIYLLYTCIYMSHKFHTLWIILKTVLPLMAGTFVYRMRLPTGNGNQSWEPPATRRKNWEAAAA